MAEFLFNQQSRTANVLKASSVATICHLATSVLGFIYRTVFIAILSASFLGINGLFWNILSILALAELGLGEVIAYRFYKPIAENNVQRVGALMAFFKQVYNLIAGLVLIFGLCLYPFLDHLIKDPSSVPSGVNLHFIYLLYLAQAVVSYTLVYRMSIWSADQKSYVGSFIQAVSESFRFAMQILVLWLSSRVFKCSDSFSFTLTLASNIALTILINVLFSWWTTCRYRPIFKVEERISRAERIQIFKDALALMCHRIGGTVVNSTDTIVLAKFVGLMATGLYSNYYLLYKTTTQLFCRVFGSFTSSFGNAYAKLTHDEYYLVFRRMQLLTLGASGLVSCCIYLLIDDFIFLWIGEEMLLPPLTSVVISVLFYMMTSRINADVSINAAGLFVKDKIRPLIESVLNLGLSIPLSIKLGVAGVLLGTIISCGLTAFWRVPYVFFRDALQRSVMGYWGQYLVFTAFSVGVLLLMQSAWTAWGPQKMTWLIWILKACLAVGFYLLAFVLVFGATSECRYFIGRLRNRFQRGRA